MITDGQTDRHEIELRACDEKLALYQFQTDKQTSIAMVQISIAANFDLFHALPTD